MAQLIWAFALLFGLAWGFAWGSRPEPEAVAPVEEPGPAATHDNGGLTSEQLNHTCTCKPDDPTRDSTPH